MFFFSRLVETIRCFKVSARRRSPNVHRICIHFLLAVSDEMKIKYPLEMENSYIRGYNTQLDGNCLMFSPFLFFFFFCVCSLRCCCCSLSRKNNLIQFLSPYKVSFVRRCDVFFSPQRNEICVRADCTKCRIRMMVQID